MLRSQRDARDGHGSMLRNRWWSFRFFQDLVIISAVFAILEVTLLGWSWQQSLVVTGFGMAIGVGGWAILGSIVKYLNKGDGN